MACGLHVSIESMAAVAGWVWPVESPYGMLARSIIPIHTVINQPRRDIFAHAKPSRKGQ